MALPLRFVLSGKFPKRGEEVMQIEKATKSLKCVWKAVVWAEVAVLTALLLFFSQFFSYDVFVSNVSNLHPQATAATFTQPR
jgi:hypothetical protein